VHHRRFSGDLGTQVIGRRGHHSGPGAQQLGLCDRDKRDGRAANLTPKFVGPAGRGGPRRERSVVAMIESDCDIHWTCFC
jgi:hypothetical protein